MFETVPICLKCSVFLYISNIFPKYYCVISERGMEDRAFREEQDRRNKIEMEKMMIVSFSKLFYPFFVDYCKAVGFFSKCNLCIAVFVTA